MKDYVLYGKEMGMMQSYTPMIQQYLRIKADYQDAFLFFRLGDFYEMFFEDALRASQELEITLTSREGGTADRIPMCGVPYHSAAGYIEKLIEKGFKVAICEQTEDPRQAKGVVKREVVQLITPGTVMEGKGLAENENNFIVALSELKEKGFGIAYTDLSTGENKAALLRGPFELLLNELALIEAKEIITDPSFNPDWQKKIKESLSAVISIEEHHEDIKEFSSICTELQDDELSSAPNRLLHYLKRTQKRSLTHLQPFKVYETTQYMKMDYYSKRNLELTESLRGKGRKGTLLWLLDDTATAMGARMLKQWIDRPLIDKAAIEGRLNYVELFKHRFIERQEVRELLRGVYDLERLAGRIAFGNANARDLIQLKKSLSQIPAISRLLASLENDMINPLSGKLDPCSELADLLESSILDNPPLSIKEGGIIKDGYHAELDQYKDASRNGKTWIAELEATEKQKTGIKSLKIGYNRVFGYYIEVTRANAHLLEEGRYERKQTLANAERYITPELKEKESLILQAEEKSMDLEYDLFISIREKVKEYIPRIQETARAISEVDVYQSMASVSDERHYSRPILHVGDRALELVDGRHPVVEKVMGSQEYVANDITMGDGREMLLITGPNMSGKSTYMRQIALTAIMAQIGCFIPAASAKLPIFDQIFTRIGAADDLISGQSTFMVEMLEARNAIVNASRNSLILFDEIGRGTSTYDGMALAQAMIEYIHDRIGAKTLFSTHYHELTILAEQLELLQNVHVSAMEQNGRLVFLHKVKSGAADKSYGIHVAELAELPDELIKRAAEILSGLENEQVRKPDTEKQLEKLDETIADETLQLSFFAKEEKPQAPVLKQNKILEELAAIDVLDMTPMQALTCLYELQKKLKK